MRPLHRLAASARARSANPFSKSECFPTKSLLQLLARASLLKSMITSPES
jgi:hypothetical protein